MGGGKCINPYKNLVKNIGKVGVHFDGGESHQLNKKTYEIDKIIHPKEVEFNQKAIDYIYKNAFGVGQRNIKKDIKRVIESILSVKNSSDKRHKVFTIFGIKIKFKRRFYNRLKK